MEKKLEGMINELSSLTILEVKELVDALKEKWGVSDTVAVAAQAAAPAAAAGHQRAAQVPAFNELESGKRSD